MIDLKFATPICAKYLHVIASIVKNVMVYFLKIAESFGLGSNEEDVAEAIIVIFKKNVIKCPAKRGMRHRTTKVGMDQIARS